jgi:hypothetical protein
MEELMTGVIKLSVAVLICLGIMLQHVAAQSTEITYQGQLQSSSTPANGGYDFEFVLYDAVSGGSQVGPLLPRNNVNVVNGLFSVNLDFGSNFPGGGRFLEIRVRQTGVGSLTTLLPRQTIRSSPYSIKTISADMSQVAATALTATSADTASTASNSLNLGGVPSSEYLTATGDGSGLTNLNASNVASGTLSNARLGQIPTANIANGAITAPKIGSGQVVKGINGSTDAVTIAGTGNISVNTAGNTVTIGSVGMSGNGTADRIPLFTAATAIGDSIITQTGSSPSGRVDIAGSALIRPPGGGTIDFHTPNGETGITMGDDSALSRADIRFDGVTMRLFAAPGVTPPQNGLIINTLGTVATSGNLGVGTFAPDTRLTVDGGPFWTSNSWRASMNLRNASAIAWDANPSGQRFGIGQSTGGLYFFRTLSSFGDQSSPSNLDMRITDAGNITQPRENNGLVKAMIYVNADGSIIRCFNGVTHTSSPSCGFTVTQTHTGRYNATFPFKVDDRFVSVTAQQTASLTIGVNIGTGFFFIGPNTVRVSTFVTDVDWIDSFEGTPFMVIIY